MHFYDFSIKHLDVFSLLSLGRVNFGKVLKFKWSPYYVHFVISCYIRLECKLEHFSRPNFMLYLIT